MAKRTRSPGMRYLGIGFELAAAVAGLALLGYWVDRHFGSEPWGLLIGLIIGIVGGMYNLVRGTLLSLRRDAEEEPPFDGGPS